MTRAETQREAHKENAVADYWIAFRLGDGPDYDNRYDGLTSAIQACTPFYWAEPRSFYLIQTEMSIEQLGPYLANAIDTTTDLILIREVSRNNSGYVGFVKDSDLFKFLPDLKKL
jgi:hypothetical protein